MTITVRILLLVVVGTIAAYMAWSQRGAVHPMMQEEAEAARDGSLTLAAVGDTVITDSTDSLESEADFTKVINLIEDASLAATNFEMVLLENGSEASREPVDWPTGTPRQSQELKRLGFDFIGRANNRSGALGAKGIAETGDIFDAAGLIHAGAGRDADDAQLARTMHRNGTSVAFLAVATSVAPEVRATRPRGDIAGRPGVNTLRFDADITVDPNTFDSLRTSAPAIQPDAEVADDELRLLGRTIRKGDRTIIKFIPQDDDVRSLVAAISRAAETAEIVVLSLHSHEPGNSSEAPAEFVRDVARTAIDAGVDVVIGHGPHQLRGIEVHNGGIILHSLGNFLFPYEPLGSRAADVFDSGADLYALSLGALDGPLARTPSPIDTTAWWESVVTIVTFENGRVRRAALHPIDLGVDLPLERRGIPRRAPPSRAEAILSRLRSLSQKLNTTVLIDGGIGYVDVPPRTEDERP